MRRCGRCGESKPYEDFAWRRRTRAQRDNYCRPCRAAYGREHYEANRQRYIDLAQLRKRAVGEERAVYLVAYFASHPCVDCGERDPEVLEFDHVGAKAFTIGTALRDRNWDSILAEIAECEVRCANCHRRRTARKGGFVRAVVAQR